MAVGPVNFAHLNDSQMEDIYSEVRTVARDARGCGKYALSYLLHQFEVELCTELSRRDALTAERVQLSLPWE